MYLLAEINWENLAAIGTVGGAIAWLIRTYAPRVIDSHLDFLGAVKDHSERQAVAIETLAGREALEAKTHEALRHGANAAAGMVEGTDKESVVMPHIDRMRKTLGS